LLPKGELVFHSYSKVEFVAKFHLNFGVRDIGIIPQSTLTCGLVFGGKYNSATQNRVVADSHILCLEKAGHLHEQELELRKIPEYCIA